MERTQRLDVGHRATKYRMVGRQRRAYTLQDGAWRRLVARVLWEHEVAGSNPAAPTDDRRGRVALAGSLSMRC